MFTVEPVFAQTNGRTPAFVYAITAFDGQIFQSTFAPPTVDSLYLIADEESVISGRNTNIYYWALTNHIEADWLAKNNVVDGVLEIVKNNQLMDDIKPVDYVVQYDANDPVSTRKLATGDQALTAYAEFKQMQLKYRDDVAHFYEEQRNYQARVDELLRTAMKEGRTVPESEYPIQPSPVEPFSLFSSEISKGYVISLPVGTYTIRVRLPDGKIQQDSTKTLVIFSRLKNGISYNVVPQSRWTKPDISRADGSVVYTPTGNVIYLQPFYQGQYNDYAYGHMLDPQDNTSRKDRSRWVTFDQVMNAVMEITPSGVRSSILPAAGYKVVQMAESGLGYEVRKLDQNSQDTASFYGYELAVSNVNASYTVRLLTRDGMEQPGSRREVRELDATNTGWMYAMSLSPIILGAGIWLTRRRTTRKIKVEG